MLKNFLTIIPRKRRLTSDQVRRIAQEYCKVRGMSCSPSAPVRYRSALEREWIVNIRPNLIPFRWLVICDETGQVLRELEAPL